MKKKPKQRLMLLIVIAVCVVALAVVVMVDCMERRCSVELSPETATTLMEDTIKGMPASLAEASQVLTDRIKVRVTEVTYGEQKDVTLHCTYETCDVLSAYRVVKDDLFTEVYDYYMATTAEGKMVTALRIISDMGERISQIVMDAETVTGEMDITFYETEKGQLTPWLSDEVVNTLFGGILTLREDAKATTELQWNGETVSIRNNGTLRGGVADCFALNSYMSDQPDTSMPLLSAWNAFVKDFRRNFVEEARWKYLVKGLGTTLAITGLALLLGVFVGFLTAIIRVTHDKEGRFTLLNRIGELYVTVIRGTPVMVQLLIIYFVILLPVGIEKFPAAVLCFGFNSGAYVSEIIRGGIMAVDGGQMEAGRSLGFGYVATMYHIILPQAFKAVLPSLCNEFIALLKETSVASYIGVADLTRGGMIIRSITFSNFMPLIAVAVVYLVLVLVLTRLVRILEKKLRRSER